MLDDHVAWILVCFASRLAHKNSGWIRLLPFTCSGSGFIWNVWLMGILCMHSPRAVFLLVQSHDCIFRVKLLKLKASSVATSRSRKSSWFCMTFIHVCIEVHYQVDDCFIIWITDPSSAWNEKRILTVSCTSFAFCSPNLFCSYNALSSTFGFMSVICIWRRLIFLFLLDWALSIKSAAIHLKQADYCSSFSFLLDTEVVVSLTSLLWVAAAKVAAEMVGSQVFLLAESLVCLKWLVRIATRLEWPAYLRMPQASPFSIAAFHASLFFFTCIFWLKFRPFVC